MLFEISPNFEEQLLQLEYLELALDIGATWWFPFIETIHVLAATLMVGFLLMVDLRLLSVAATSYPARFILRQQLPWVWAGFMIAVITGSLMFITNALAYATNPAMQVKLLLILTAGINTVLVHWMLKHNHNDHSVLMPGILGKGLTPTSFCGGLSLTLWASVVFAGRWIGHIQ